MTAIRERFTGRIFGLGSSCGVRAVVGDWTSSPLGSFSDVMLERADGHRILYAPSPEVAAFIEATYVFDEVRIVPVAAYRSGRRWQVATDDLDLAFTTGARMPLGWLLRAVPPPLATSPWWASAIDPVASRVMRGVHTRGVAREGRREWYGATDLHTVTALSGQLAGASLGTLAPVDPPCRFGFSSTPRTPSMTSVVTTVERRG